MSTQYSRPLVKRSGITGTMPTIPASLDINTFLNTDIIEGEMFYNIPDNKLYISDGSAINVIATTPGTGGFGLAATLLNGNTTSGNNIVMSNGDFITSASGSAELQLNNANVILKSFTGSASAEFSAASASAIGMSYTNSGVNYASVYANTSSSSLAYTDSINKFNSVSLGLDSLLITMSDSSLMTSDTQMSFTSTGMTAFAATNMSFKSGTIGLTGVNELNLSSLAIGMTATGSFNVSVFNQQFIDMNDTEFDMVSSDTSYTSKVQLGQGGGICVNLNNTNLISGTATSLKITYDGIQHTKHNITEPLVYDLVAGVTTNTTQTTIYTIDLGFTGACVAVDGIVTGSGTGTTGGYGATLFAAFKNTAGVVAQLGTTDKSEKTNYSTATSNISVTGTNVVLTVTGEASTTITWVARLNYKRIF